MKQPYSYDTETTGTHPYSGDRMFAYSTCSPDEKIEIQRVDGSLLRQQRGHRKLVMFWEDDAKIKVMHNASFDRIMTRLEAPELGPVLDRQEFHDTMIESHIVRNHHPGHGLKELAWELAGISTEDEEEVKRLAVAVGGNYQWVPENNMRRYQWGDAYRTELLHLFFNPKITANHQWVEIYDNERALLRTTERMQARGIMVNRSACSKLIDELEAKVQDVRDQFAAYTLKHTGQRFHPGQTEKVSWFLFDVLKFPMLERTKSGAGSTDKDKVLLPLRERNPHEVLDLILMYRSWSHGVTTLRSYMDLADPDGILHPNIHTNGASKTSRQSCSNPNLQNVEKEGVLKNPFPVPARRVFRPRPGYVNFLIDYSGIELRLLVHYSGDERMIQELRKPNGDPHALACELALYPPFSPEELYEYPFVSKLIQRGFSALEIESKEWKMLRGAGKNTNFAIPYGAGAAKTAMTLNIPEALGRRRLATYRRLFPGLCNLSQQVRSWVQTDGYVETRFGRRLHVPRNKPYVGTNYLIQGTASGILKRAEVRVDKYLKDATADEARLLLPIHDEIIFEYPRSRLRDAPGVIADIRKLMIDFPMFSVPMEVDVKICTTNWTQTTKYKKGGTE